MRTVEEINEEAAELAAKGVLLNVELQQVIAREELFAQLTALGFEKMPDNPNDLFVQKIGEKELSVFIDSDNDVDIWSKETIHYETTLESAASAVAGLLIAAKENA
jgi:hypothetical protein